MKILGIALIAFGIVMLLFRGFSFTREKKVLDIGPIEINQKQKESVGWPVYAGAIAMAAGVFVLIGAKKK